MWHDPRVLWVSMGFLVAALLYASAGHGGASAYLAIMALAEFEPQAMRPIALCLNVVVAGAATLRYRQAGYLPWRALLPFVATSVPFAFLGGALSLHGTLYRRILGGVLAFAAARLVHSAMGERAREERTPSAPLPGALGCGAAIGLLSGLTGVGGGIFLSPLLLLLGWAGPRNTAGMSAAFIVLNSLAGIAARPSSLADLPGWIPLWAGLCLLGGWVGATLGSRVLPVRALRFVLAAVLLIAAFKLLTT